MSIRKRTAIIITVIFVSLLCLNTLIFMGAYNKNLQEQHRTIVSLEAEKGISEVKVTSDRLAEICYDWGTWDDTVAFLNGKLPNYENEYFYDSYFEKVGIDIFVIADKQGDFILVKAANRAKLDASRVETEIGKMIKDENLVQKVTDGKAFSVNRLLFLKEGFLEVNARSVTNNAGNDPPQGIIFTGNFIFNGPQWSSKDYKISTVTGNPDMHGFDKLGDAWYKFEHLGNLKLYIPSELVSGQNITIERNYPGVSSFRSRLILNLIIISLFVVLAGIISISFFRKYFLQPLSKIMEFMSNVNLNDIENKRLEMKEQDEFSQLAEYINEAVGRIETDSKIIKDLNQRYVQALEAADAGSFSLSVTDMIFRMDEKLANLIGYREKELEIKIEKLRRYFDPDDVEKLIKDAKYYGVSILNNDIVLGVMGPHEEKRYLLFKSDLNRNREEDDMYDVTGIALEYTEEYLRERQLEYISFHDVLTGLYNRSFFENTIDKLELNQKFPYGVIIGDMNGLKMVNDTFGHEEGDNLLKAMAAIFRGSCRAVDLNFRWGGDEFAVVLPGASEDVVRKVIEKITKTMDEYSGSIIPPSISLGYSVRDSSVESSSAAIRSAEEQMYGQKVSQNKEVRQNLIEYFRKRLDKAGIETLNHNNRLLELSEKAGKAVGFSGGKIEELRDLASLHDIGMVSVDERIVMKDGALTEEEKMAMRLHTETGFRICKATPELSHIAYSVLTHHEHFDGGGYPKGLKGSEIPSIARLFSILDAYEALTNERPYRRALSKEEAIIEIRSKAGTQFDPQMVEECIAVFQNS